MIQKASTLLGLPEFFVFVGNAGAELCSSAQRQDTCSIDPLIMRGWHIHILVICHSSQLGKRFGPTGSKQRLGGGWLRGRLRFPA